MTAPGDDPGRDREAHGRHGRCAYGDAVLARLLDGDPAEQMLPDGTVVTGDAVDAHVASCPDCRRRLEAARRLDAVVAGVSGAGGAAGGEGAAAVGGDGARQAEEERLLDAVLAAVAWDGAGPGGGAGEGAFDDGVAGAARGRGAAGTASSRPWARWRLASAAVAAALLVAFGFALGSRPETGGAARGGRADLARGAGSEVEAATEAGAAAGERTGRGEAVGRGRRAVASEEPPPGWSLWSGSVPGAKERSRGVAASCAAPAGLRTMPLGDVAALVVRPDLDELLVPSAWFRSRVLRGRMGGVPGFDRVPRVAEWQAVGRRAAHAVREAAFERLSRAAAGVGGSVRAADLVVDVLAGWPRADQGREALEGALERLRRSPAGGAVVQRIRARLNAASRAHVDQRALRTAALLGDPGLDEALVDLAGGRIELADRIVGPVHEPTARPGRTELLLQLWRSLAARGVVDDSAALAMRWFAEDRVGTGVGDELRRALEQSGNAAQRRRILLGLAACRPQAAEQLLGELVAGPSYDEALLAGFALVRLRTAGLASAESVLGAGPRGLGLAVLAVSGERAAVRTFEQSCWSIEERALRELAQRDDDAFRAVVRICARAAPPDGTTLAAGG